MKAVDGGTFAQALDCADRGEDEQALALYQLCIRAGYSVAESAQNAAEIFKKKGDYLSAELYYRQGLLAAPHPFLYHGLSDCLTILQRYPEAWDCLKCAFKMAPDFPPLHNQMGILLAALQCYPEAIAAFKTAIGLYKKNRGGQYAEALFHLGFLYLSQGEWEKGFPLYEYRLRRAGNTPSSLSGCAHWRPGDGVHNLLIRGEQGVGDITLFARFLPYMPAERISFYGDPRLERLLERIVDTAHQGPQYVPFAEISHSKTLHHWKQIGIGSLPWALLQCGWSAQRLQTVIQTAAYLCPHLPMQQYFQAKYRRLFPGQVRIGVTIQIRNPKEQPKKDWLEPFFQSWMHASRHQIAWVHLDHADKALSGAYCDSELPENSQQLEALCAQMAALDAVVGADNSVMNLASAMGLPTAIILPFACDWRWMPDQRAFGFGQKVDYVYRTPWYPTARLFRADRPGANAVLFERFRDACEKEFTPCPSPTLL